MQFVLFAGIAFDLNLIHFGGWIQSLQLEQGLFKFLERRILEVEETISYKHLKVWRVMSHDPTKQSCTITFYLNICRKNWWLNLACR